MFKTKEDRSKANTEKALIGLRNRRRWLISEIAVEKTGLTGGTFNEKIDDHAGLRGLPVAAQCVSKVLYSWVPSA